MPEKKKDHAEWAITKGRATSWQKEQHWQRIIFISVSLVIVVVLALIGYAIYRNATDEDNEGNPTVLKVNDQSFDMDYYVKMLRLYGIGSTESSQQSTKAQQILQTIESKEIIRQLAPGLGLSVTEDEITAEINKQFGLSEGKADTTPTPAATPIPTATPASTPTYDNLLKQLKEIGISEKIFRVVIASDILEKKVQDFIGQRDVKDEMPQSHLEGILIDVKAPANVAITAEGNTEGQIETKAAINENPAKIRETIQTRLDAGEDFAALAEEFSRESGSKVKGGDLGWMPRELLSGELAKAFDGEIGMLSQLIQASASADNTQYWLVRVLEKQDLRPLEENQLKTLQNKAFNDWFTEQRKTLTIVDDLLNPDLRALAITKALS